MSIQYTLYPNNLTSDPSDHRAVVKSRNSYGFEKLADEMIRQGSTVNRPDILAVLNDAVTACTALLMAGNRINFGDLVKLFPVVKGVFDGPTDAFDPSRHQVDVRATPGTVIRNTIRQNASAQRIVVEPPKPILLRYFDLATESFNESVTVGNNGKVEGKNLTFDPDQADEGIFFVPTSGGAEVKVASIPQIGSTVLIFLNPAMPAGTYQLEVRSRLFGGTEIRRGLLKGALTVA